MPPPNETRRQAPRAASNAGNKTFLGEIKIALVNAASNRTDTDQPIVASLFNVDATAISAITDNDDVTLRLTPSNSSELNVPT